MAARDTCLVFVDTWPTRAGLQPDKIFQNTDFIFVQIL